MKILAIDTTTNFASVCLTENNKILSEITLNCAKNHSSLLIPIIKQVIENSKINIKDVDFFACCSGPGSFTGLRVGVSTTKALALSLNKKIISVPTLKLIAYTVHSNNKTIIPILDAKAKNIFASFYIWNSDKLTQISDPIFQNIYDLLTYIKNKNINPIFVGEGANVYKEDILNFSKDFEIAPYIFNIQRAYFLASISYEYALENNFTSIQDFEIQYMRKPQAEIQLKENFKIND